MTKPTLYYHPGSPPARACVMVAREIGLDIELKLIDFQSMEHTSEAYSKINPAQTVPSFSDNNFIINDSHAICLYMIEKYAKSDQLYPKNNPKLRTIINDRLFFDASFLFPRGYNIMYPVFILGQSSIPKEMVNQIYRAYKVVERFLTNSKWIATNDQMTLADIAMFAWFEAFTRLFTIENYPKIAVWLSRMRNLDSYEEMKIGAKQQADQFLTVMEQNKIFSTFGQK
ncbi:hypothetical protein PVAND_011947 [Polypedilum vanderplanki]|uniref:glutathione transferase n=1 Tax=Polypedilum vanderplanki TaxID=319348 RepID=A0A9J6CKV0_POLVA|nr:hypothetical protein PVAND_011947 [Polypedilum vanderplanki]